MRMKAGEEDRQAGGRGGRGVGGQEGQGGRTKKESRQRGRGGAEMKRARSHLFFVNRWVEVSDCDESQSTTDTHAVHTRALTSKSWNTLHAWMHISPHYYTAMERLM